MPDDSSPSALPQLPYLGASASNFRKELLRMPPAEDFPDPVPLPVVCCEHFPIARAESKSFRT
eukprot:3355505-Amphidinium_carterae.1